MKWNYYIEFVATILFCLGTIACSDTVSMPVAEEDTPMEYYLNLTLRMEDEVQTRANDTDTPLMPDTDSEKRIRSLHVFFSNGNAEDYEVISLNVSLIIDRPIEVRVPLKSPLSDGTLIYLGANLNARQIAAFRQGNDVYSLVYDDEDYVNDLSPYSIGYDGDNQSDIPMFCTEVVQAQDDDEDNVYTVSFTLKRIVAKVLLTSQETNDEVEGGENGVAYASLLQDKDPMFQGWIRLDNIWYIVNSRNRQTYIMQKLVEGSTDTDANVEDPNMDLQGFINEAFKTDETVVSNYETMVKDNFSYIGRSQYRKKPHFRKALVYDESRMDGNGTNPYTEGVYTPENTFSFNDLTSSDEENLKNFGSAWGMITHLSIMAKFTPRILNVEYGLFDFIQDEENGYSEEIRTAIENLRPSVDNSVQKDDVYQIDCGTEAIAQTILTASLSYNEMLSIGSEKEYPEETFFFHEETDGTCPYYTYGAARIKCNSFDPSNPKNLGNYVPHLTGWGYYYTYIDNRSEEKKTVDNPFTFYKHGQVERNRYYILKINSFSNPGSSIVNPNYIEVNTETIDWLHGGSGNLILQ